MGLKDRVEKLKSRAEGLAAAEGDIPEWVADFLTVAEVDVVGAAYINAMQRGAKCPEQFDQFLTAEEKAACDAAWAAAKARGLRGEPAPLTGRCFPSWSDIGPDIEGTCDE